MKKREITNNMKSSTTQVKITEGSPLEFSYKRPGHLPGKQHFSVSKPKLTVPNSSNNYQMLIEYLPVDPNI